MPDLTDEAVTAAERISRSADSFVKSGRHRTPEGIAALQAAADLMEGAAAGYPITASAPRGDGRGQIARMAAVAGRAQPSPAHSAAGVSSPVVTAAIGAGTLHAGAVLTDPGQLAEITSETLRRMAMDPDHFGRKHLVASATWEYPEERRLGPDSPTENTRKIEDVCGFGAGRYDRRTRALVASGGICLPVNVDYAVPTWSTADRPVRDGLPAFQASRGGIRFVAPPDIGVPDLQGTASGAGTATTVWPEATDASPGTATKPVWQVACGTEHLVYVNAIPTRVQFGNMQSRFFPEQIAANTDQAIAIAAREAELELLTLMYEASKQVVPEQYLGATRDLLASVDLLVAQYRYSHRVPRSAAFTVVMPDWAKDLVRADLARELAHDNTNDRDVLAIGDDIIDRWFSVRGINVLWALDGLKAGTYGTGGSALLDQFFPLATAGAEPQWPNQNSDGTIQVGWLLFPEGAWQYLDGGRLDLGVVRDSLLDATNDYETFVEVFESVAFRGVESYQVQSIVKPTGASAGTVAASAYAE